MCSRARARAGGSADEAAGWERRERAFDCRRRRDADGGAEWIVRVDRDAFARVVACDAFVVRMEGGVGSEDGVRVRVCATGRALDGARAVTRRRVRERRERRREDDVVGAGGRVRRDGARV